MTVHEHTTIALYDDGGEQMGNYTMGEGEFRLIDGKHSVAFNVTEAADLIAFLQRVQNMQKPMPAPEPAKPVDITKAKPGDLCVRRGTLAKAGDVDDARAAMFDAWRRDQVGEGAR
jgi:hypothetical protein